MISSSFENSPREKQRLNRLDNPHANAWVTAVPSSEDGFDTILSPRAFRISVLRLLGLPICPSSLSCPLCVQPMDTLGDHSLCCSKTRDTIIRHNSIRNWVFKIAQEGMLCPEMEKIRFGEAEIGPSRRRPADIAIPIWANGKSLAIDVAVVCPLVPSHLPESEPCEAYACKKHQKYDKGFLHSSFDFVPMIFETGGAINRDGESILKQLFRFASKRSSTSYAKFVGRAWARLSCTLQRSVSQMVLNRTFGISAGDPDLDGGVGTSLGAREVEAGAFDY